MTSEHGLRRLEAQIAKDLELLRYPERPWMRARYTAGGLPIHDVVIVGGGQGGLATAFGLLRERIDDILVVDENPDRGITGSLFEEDRAEHFASLQHFAEQEF